MILSAILIAISFTSIIIFSNKNNNLIKINYKEVMEKVDNKESFILCISSSKCSHCENYNPKLEKIANDYNIKIYYTDVDKYKDSDYETFKNDFSFDGGTPVTIFIKNGVEETTATRINGDVSSDKIISKLKNNGYID